MRGPLDGRVRGPMSPESTSPILRYAPFIFIGIVAINLAYGRRRAGALVAAGRVTQDELDGFLRGSSILLGGPFLLLGLVTWLSSAPDPMCAMTYPPVTRLGLTLWLTQAFISGW